MVLYRVWSLKAPSSAQQEHPDRNSTSGLMHTLPLASGAHHEAVRVAAQQGIRQRIPAVEVQAVAHLPDRHCAPLPISIRRSFRGWNKEGLRDEVAYPDL